MNEKNERNSIWITQTLWVTVRNLQIFDFQFLNLWNDCCLKFVTCSDLINYSNDLFVFVEVRERRPLSSFLLQVLLFERLCKVFNEAAKSKEMHSVLNGSRIRDTLYYNVSYDGKFSFRFPISSVDFLPHRFSRNSLNIFVWIYEFSKCTKPFQSSNRVTWVLLISFETLESLQSGQLRISK